MEAEEIEFPSRDGFIRWYEELKNKEKILLTASSYDETKSIMRVSIITQNKHYEVRYPVFLFDFFPEFETEEELIGILRDMQDMAKNKVFIDDKPLHPTALARKIVELIEYFRFIEPVQNLDERKFKLLLGLLQVLKESVNTWISAMEAQIKGGFLSHLLKKRKE